MTRMECEYDEDSYEIIAFVAGRKRITHPGKYLTTTITNERNHVEVSIIAYCQSGTPVSVACDCLSIAYFCKNKADKPG